MLSQYIAKYTPAELEQLIADGIKVKKAKIKKKILDEMFKGKYADRYNFENPKWAKGVHEGNLKMVANIGKERPAYAAGALQRMESAEAVRNELYTKVRKAIREALAAA